MSTGIYSIVLLLSVRQKILQLNSSKPTGKNLPHLLLIVRNTEFCVCGFLMFLTVNSGYIRKEL
jgi:hypothetical protein